MTLPTTETLSKGEPIDALSALDASTLMLDAQQAALTAVRKSVPAIVEGASAMAAAIRGGHSIVYAAAGSSGLMALADACELPGTFGVSPNAIQVHMAGGVPADGHMPGNTEDDTKAAAGVARTIKLGDTVIALSASGTTPYALHIAASAKATGATVVGIANNPATPLLDIADIAICLKTPPEVIAGSTRLGAGTAQKAALNLMSSLMGIELGHVYRGLMVNVVADNAKLLKRAGGIIADIAKVSGAEAEAALQRSGGNTKLATLVAAGCSLSHARELLEVHRGHLGPCFQSLRSNQDVNV